MPDVVPGASPRVTQIDRPRLLARLQRRFEVRLTTVTGGGGSGKTTLLTQAMAAEADQIDVWYPCAPADRAHDRLRSGLLDVTRQRLHATIESDDDPLIEIADLVLAESPTHVCFVLDDVHVLGGLDLVDELLAILPSNGHVVLAGRGRVELDIARLDASGQVERIDQAELLLSDDELVSFANLRGVDIGKLADAHGWPAFVELATRSKGSAPADYLRQEALESLSPERRRQLGAFAFVGGGDDDVCQAVTGIELDVLVAHLPLVRWTGESAQLHDLWGELFDDELDDELRTTAAIAAARVARDRHDFDRAIALCVIGAAVDELLTTLERAVTEGAEGGLRAHQLNRWLTTVPDQHRAAPIADLIAGLLERERDPTSAAAAELLERAATGFRSAENHDLELVALAQLGYVARISGEPDRIRAVMEHVAELSERFTPAVPFVPLCEAWVALAEGKPDRQLSALQRIDPTQLPQLWRATREHLIAHALFNLGRPHEALETVPRDITQRHLAIPGALVTELQCLWFAGQPDIALAKLPDGLGEEYGARDQFVTNAWLAMAHAYSGDVSAARRLIALAEQHVGRQPGLLVGAQLIGVRLIIDVAEGREDEAGASLAAILEQLPLGDGVTEQLLRNLLPLPYVMAPSSRPFWHAHEFGPAIDRARELAAAFVAARETGDLAPIASMTWPDPGFVAASLPVGWAIEFALHGHLAGRYEAQHLLDWLSEHWGRPARQALTSWLGDEQLGAPARVLLTSTPSPPEQPIAVSVLGETSLQINHTESADPNWRRERVRSILVWLVLNPDTNRSRLAATLWPDLEPERAAKNLRTTLNYLHGVLEPHRASGDASWFIRVRGQQISLHSSLDIDLWRFTRLIDAADAAERRGRPTEALPLLVEACSLWRGDIAADLDHEWLELERIHVRGRFVRGACRAAELLVATGRPTEAIEVVRQAVEVDPWNERGYEALAAGYRAMGDITSARAVEARAAERMAALDG